MSGLDFDNIFQQANKRKKIRGILESRRFWNLDKVK